jgi:hypothetical protein
LPFFFFFSHSWIERVIGTKALPSCVAPNHTQIAFVEAHPLEYTK